MKKFEILKKYWSWIFLVVGGVVLIIMSQQMRVMQKIALEDRLNSLVAERTSLENERALLQEKLKQLP